MGKPALSREKPGVKPGKNRVQNRKQNPGKTRVKPGSTWSPHTPTIGFSLLVSGNQLANSFSRRLDREALRDPLPLPTARRAEGWPLNIPSSPRAPGIPRAHGLSGRPVSAKAYSVHEFRRFAGPLPAKTRRRTFCLEGCEPQSQRRAPGAGTLFHFAHPKP